MWRDSFAVPVYVGDNRPVSRTFEDDFLLNVERQANHLRRTDSSSFVRVTRDGCMDFGEMLNHTKLPKKNEDFALLSQTPVDSSLPSVRDMFVDFSTHTDDHDGAAVFRNPLVPATPPRPRRKTGSFVGFLKGLHVSRESESRKDAVEEKRESEERIQPAEQVQSDDYETNTATKKISSASSDSMLSSSGSLKHSDSSASDITAGSIVRSSTSGAKKPSLAASTEKKFSSSGILKHADSSGSDVTTTSVSRSITPSEKLGRLDSVEEGITGPAKTSIGKTFKKSLSFGGTRSKVETPRQPVLYD